MKKGLEDLVAEKYERIGGNRVFPMGMPVGHGLTDKSAQEMGLLPNTPIGVGIIDAHAGGLGLVKYICLLVFFNSIQARNVDIRRIGRF